jgi:hypothetical protein
MNAPASSHGQAAQRWRWRLEAFMAAEVAAAGACLITPG